MGITRPWKNRTQASPDATFQCPSRLPLIWFQDPGLSRTRSRRTYNHHPIHRYRRTLVRLGIRLTAVISQRRLTPEAPSPYVEVSFRPATKPRRHDDCEGAG